MCRKYLTLILISLLALFLLGTTVVMPEIPRCSRKQHQVCTKDVQGKLRCVCIYNNLPNPIVPSVPNPSFPIPVSLL